MRKISEATLNLMKSIVPVPRIEETYHIQIVTPMWGGGNVSGINDETKLVRETSIRGQLRFWFRATSGAHYETPSDLFKRESEIFGTTDTPSSIVVRVSKLDFTKSELDFTKKDTKSYADLCPEGELSTFGYILFPFKNKNKFGHTASFDLTLSYPKDCESQNEVHIALWAWLNFGGIGARTRRGCGALFCKRLAPDYKGNRVVWNQDKQDKQDKQDNQDFVTQDFFSKKLENEGIIDWSTLVSRTFDNDKTRDWPTLGGGTFINPANLSANTLDAWEKAIEDYKSFRQGLGFAPEGADDSPGLYRWPEADAIRTIKKSWSQGHEPHNDRPQSFPRAELGLPIRFRFKDKGKGDPEDFDLLPYVPGVKYSNCNRACSPVIVKPLIFKDGVAAPCVVFLNGSERTRVTTVRLQGNQKVADAGNAKYKNSPLERYSPQNGSALEGFKNYVKDHGYQSVITNNSGAIQ